MSNDGGLFDKVKDFIHGHPEQARQGLDKVGDVLDARTGGRYSEHIDRVSDKVGGTLGIPTDQSEPAPGQPVPVPDEPAPGQPVPVPGDPGPAPAPGQPDPGQPTPPAPGEPSPAPAPGQPPPPVPGPPSSPVPGPPSTPAPTAGPTTS